jgi:hypothetical protein
LSLFCRLFSPSSITIFPTLRLKPSGQKQAVGFEGISVHGILAHQQFSVGSQGNLAAQPGQVAFISIMMLPGMGKCNSGELRWHRLRRMANDFEAIFGTLKGVLEKYAGRLQVKTDTAIEYTVLTKMASPRTNHKGQPTWFSSERLGKAYVSFHLMPL